MTVDCRNIVVIVVLWKTLTVKRVHALGRRMISHINGHLWQMLSREL